METYCEKRCDQPPIDLDSLLQRCMGRLELMERMLASFTDNAAADIDELTHAIERSDSAEVARIAHKLKGTSLTVSAVPLAKVADQLHHVASHDLPVEDRPDLKQFSPDLAAEYQSIIEHLNNLRAGGPL